MHPCCRVARRRHAHNKARTLRAFFMRGYFLRRCTAENEPSDDVRGTRRNARCDMPGLLRRQTLRDNSFMPSRVHPAAQQQQANQARQQRAFFMRGYVYPADAPQGGCSG